MVYDYFRAKISFIIKHLLYITKEEYKWKVDDLEKNEIQVI